MNLVINQKQQNIKPMIVALVIATAAYLLTTVSTVPASYIKYNIPATSVDTGYHPSYKNINNW